MRASRAVPKVEAVAAKSDLPEVVAIIATYNEADVIECVIQHLVENGVAVYVVDNMSTDDTVTAITPWLGRGVLGIESFPAQAGTPFVWQEILDRKMEIAEELGADWYIHHDADEIRYGPWPNLSLHESIAWVDRLGFNAIDFRLLNFPPVNDSFERGDVRGYFRRYEEGAEHDRVQIKAWRAGQGRVLAGGGHDVKFGGRRIFPMRFILCHYPIRGQAHGVRKVLKERKTRFAAIERAQGWHVQYDGVLNDDHLFLRNPASLEPFDLDRMRLQVQLEATAEPAPTTASSTRRDEYEGFLDVADEHAIAGWARRRTSDTEKVHVDIWAGPELIETVRANQPRNDLASAGIGDGKCAFWVTTPPRLSDANRNAIWANIAGTDVQLGGCPRILGAP
jgi:hypothetical protein